MEVPVGKLQIDPRRQAQRLRCGQRLTEREGGRCRQIGGHRHLDDGHVGVLSAEFYEELDDFPGAIDGTWDSGFLLFGVACGPRLTGSVPVHAAEGYLLTLIRKGFRVAVCEQMESPAEAKKRGGKALVRRYQRLVSRAAEAETRIGATDERLSTAGHGADVVGRFREDDPRRRRGSGDAR